MKISHFFLRSWRMQLPVTLVWSFKYTWGDLEEICLIYVACASCTHSRIYALWVVSMRGFVLCGLCWLHPWEDFIVLCGLFPWEDLLCFVGCAHERIYNALCVVHIEGFMLCGLCPWEDFLCFVGCTHERIYYTLWVEVFWSNGFLDIIRTQEASELAQQHNKMDIYTEIVKDVATKDECLKLAR
jgi:hypothetical protein